MHRPRLALAFALAALAAALVGAVGPARDARATYVWPPRALPDQTPSRFWYSPLLLVRHRPESISARLPCSPPQALARAPRPVVVLASARSPQTQERLVVTRADGELVVAVGERVLERVPLSEGNRRSVSCAYRLRLAPGRWLLEGGPDGAVREGRLETMPAVTGLFSALDLRSGTPPSVEVTTAVDASRPTSRQKAAWTVSALAIVAVLLLVAAGRRPKRLWVVVVSGVRTAAAHAHPVDGLVAVVLVTWWLLSPSYWDDGWITARLAAFRDSGAFSTYYDVLGASNPLGYWLDWTQHWLLPLSDSLLVLRLPALGCLAVTWLLCRYMLGRALAPAAVAGPPLWALAAAFLLGAFAWGMTVRPEPVLALLVTGVAASIVRFLERETAAPLALVAILVPLSLSVHPAGLVSLAPLLVAAPRLGIWIRSRIIVASAMLVAAVALLAVLLFVGSDLQQRRDDARTFDAYGTTGTTWRDEAVRYERLSEFPFATPVRRGWVALAILAVLSLLLRRRGRERAALDFGGVALALGLALLIATPSKWGWHFGALIGLAAVAVGSEASQLRDESGRTRGWRARPFLVLGAVMLAAAWSWSPRTAWAALDLRTLDWILGLEARLPLSKLAFLLPPLLLAGAALLELARGRRSRLPETPWRVAAWAGPILAFPAIAFTLGLLVADTVKTDAWTLGGQSLDTLRAATGCGLADDVVAVAPASVRPVQTVDARVPRGGPASTVPHTDGVASYRVRTSTPWLEARVGRRIGLFLTTGPVEPYGMRLEWGSMRGGRIQTAGEGEIPAPFLLDRAPGPPAWSFVAMSELPPRPSGANVFRVSARGRAITVAPVTYQNKRLARRLEPDSNASFVVPELRMYFPCVRQPRLRDGVAEVPHVVVAAFDSTSWLSSWSGSPYRLLPDLYPLERLSLTDSRLPPQGVALFVVDRNIPGAALAPATRGGP